MVDTRNLDRDSLFLLADLGVAGSDAPTRVKIRNLSAGGMMAEGQAEVVQGSRVTVDIRKIGKVSGVVAWVQGRLFGVAFAQEIDPKLARLQISGGDKEAPAYARSVTNAGFAVPATARIRKV